MSRKNPGGTHAVCKSRAEPMACCIMCDLPVSFYSTACIRNIVHHVKYLAAYAHNACEHARRFTYKMTVNLVRFFFS